MRKLLQQGPGRIAERAEELRLALGVAGLARNVAPELPAIARPGDRERRREDQIGIVGLLRARMMLQMIAAIGAGLGEDRIGAEPLAQRHVQLLVVGKAAMGAVMHQDSKPELARAD